MESDALTSQLIGRFGAVLLIAFAAQLQSGCSVFMAARLPVEKDLAVLTPGVPRSHVIAELGEPLASHEQPYGSLDVFAFKQGYATPVKFSRLAFHTAADVLTWGLWEIVGTPIEVAFQGELVRAEVAYSHADTVQRVEYFSGAHLAHGSPAVAGWMRGKWTGQTAVVGNFPQSQSLEEPDVLKASASDDADDGEHSIHQLLYNPDAEAAAMY